MKIWLIEGGEPLPIDRSAKRLWRIGLLAQKLYTMGHQVVWWASSFDHTHKIHRIDRDAQIAIADRYRIHLLHGPAYKKNISVARLVNHRIVARKFKQLSRLETPPDIILCCLPTIDLCAAATAYGRHNNVPVVLDIRDLWPDIMLDVFPARARALARLALTPMFKSVQRSFANSSAIIGITGEFVEKGLQHAGRPANENDLAFPHGYHYEKPDEIELQNGVRFWREYGIDKESGKFLACFIGTISRRIELDTVISAAKIINKTGRDAVFVICGKGEDAARCKELARDCENIIFPGWIGPGQIYTLMELASIGIIPYPSTRDFRASIPNKAVEYMAGGLPVISSVRGVLEKLLANNQCGLTYANRDPDDLCRLISRLYDKPELLSEMSARASTLYRDDFTADKVYENMALHLEKIAAEYSGCE